MNMVDIILKKKAGEALSAEEIRFFAQGAAAGTIPDYQLSALLMAMMLAAALLAGMLWGVIPAIFKA